MVDELPPKGHAPTVARVVDELLPKGHAPTIPVVVDERPPKEHAPTVGVRTSNRRVTFSDETSRKSDAPKKRSYASVLKTILTGLND